MRAPRETPRRNRFTRRGGVVQDVRTFTAAFLEPYEHKYRKGDAIFVPPTSSPAREKFKAARLARRAELRAAVIA